ncbi:hypothetical protein [Coleofasciculus sp. FACHB-1120]|nr:hypothetical protein [Coleofasciculus sp. FACHB-1120]
MKVPEHKRDRVYAWIADDKHSLESDRYSLSHLPETLLQGESGW